MELFIARTAMELLGGSCRVEELRRLSVGANQDWAIWWGIFEFLRGKKRFVTLGKISTLKSMPALPGVDGPTEFGADTKWAC